ncbi:hypothetical protein D3Z48_08255 [Clostridiaceae bacterium]|nr:hypothetical protein [Clostridiaceae bacterium]
MESTSRIFPSETSTASEPIDLTMDAFYPIEPPLRFRTDSGPAPKEDLLPYAWQDPRNAACIAIRTPGGSYESRSFRIDDEIGEITIDADGVCILLDGRNVVVYLDTEHPTVYWDGLCDVTFTA